MDSNAKPRRYETLKNEEPLWASEPFRVFFPLGLIASVLGVLIWPLFYFGFWKFPPQLQHPRMMIFGFGGAFGCGFLGTAWPRFLEAEALRAREVVTIASAWLAMVILILTGHIRSGDCAFGIMLLALLVILLLRMRKDRDLPPPGFALALFSVALSAIAAFLWAFAPGTGGEWLITFTRLMLWQGFLLLPLLGVGSYLFARFLQQPGERPPAASPGKRALGVWLGAALILISFAVEAGGAIQIGSAIRFAAIVVWVVFATPALWKQKAENTRAWSLKIIFASIALTFLTRTFFPGPGHALAHLLFVCGFGLALLLVSDRVTHGHCGDLQALGKKSRLWRWLVWLSLLAAATRGSADFKASLIISHHSYASLLWIAVVVAFGWFTAPLWRKQN